MSIKNYIIGTITALALVVWIFAACAVAMETTPLYLITFTLSSAWLILFGIANGGMDDV